MDSPNDWQNLGPSQLHPPLLERRSREGLRQDGSKSRSILTKTVLAKGCTMSTKCMRHTIGLIAKFDSFDEGESSLLQLGDCCESVGAVIVAAVEA